MYILKNALRNITRAMSRSILNIILVLIISVSSCVALTIKESADTAKENAYSNLNVTGSIAVDRQKIMEKLNGDKSSMMEYMNKSLSLEEMEKYAQSQYVDDFRYNLSISLNGTDELNPFTTEEESEDSNEPNNKNPFGGMSNKFMSRGDFVITGYNSHDNMTDFINGTKKIIEGAMFDASGDNNQCIISNELAQFNDVKLGDKIKLSNINNEDEVYEVTVSGIYENTDSSSMTMMNMKGGVDPANDIYMNYDTVNEIIKKSKENPISVTNSITGEDQTSEITGTVHGTYVFKDAKAYDSFTNDVVSLGLDDSIYSVTSLDVNKYEESIRPLDNLSKYSIIFFYVVLIIGGAILIVFNLFTVKSRKYEIGVLAAIGMKKGKVAAQFIIEALIICLIAVTIGAGIGAASSGPIAESMLQSQITSVQESEETQKNNFGQNYQGRGPGKGQMMGYGQPNNMASSNNVSYIDTINASTNLTVILELMGIGLLLTLLSSLIAMISILKYEPLKILNDRV